MNVPLSLLVRADRADRMNDVRSSRRVWLFTTANGAHGANADRASDAIAHQRGSQSWSKGHSIRRPRREHKFQRGSKTRQQPVSSRPSRELCFGP
jgi:hypothetical protein